MQGADFQQYIDKFPCLKPFYRGTFSVDSLPRRLNYRNFLIFNSDFKSGSGLHWLALYRSSETHIELFDSLSLNDEKKNLISSYFKFKQDIIFNETPFQLPDSISCGLFVVYYLIERSFNLDLDFLHFLELSFDENCETNERTVATFCTDILLDKY